MDGQRIAEELFDDRASKSATAPRVNSHRSAVSTVPEAGSGTEMDYDRAAEYVVCLLEEACEAYQRDVYHLAVFLAVSAMEEAERVDALGHNVLRPILDEMIDVAGPPREASARDSGLKPSVLTGPLPDLVGDGKSLRLFWDAKSGRLRRLKGRTIHLSLGERSVETPKEVIDRERALEVLLLSIEAASDFIVGWTSGSLELGENLSAMSIKLKRNAELNN